MSSRNAAPDDAKTVARETTRYVKGNRFSTKKYERSIFFCQKVVHQNRACYADVLRVSSRGPCPRRRGLRETSSPGRFTLAPKLVSKARENCPVGEAGLRNEPIEPLYVKGKGLDCGTVPPRLPV